MSHQYRNGRAYAAHQKSYGKCCAISFHCRHVQFPASSSYLALLFDAHTCRNSVHAAATCSAPTLQFRGDNKHAHTYTHTVPEDHSSDSHTRTATAAAHDAIGSRITSLHQLLVPCAAPLHLMDHAFQDAVVRLVRLSVMATVVATAVTQQRMVSDARRKATPTHA